jgi:archaellum biogenesis ATPase FlaH
MEQQWIWDGYVFPGGLTMITGHSKVGKSTLIEGLLRAMQRGDAFLGRATSPATAVFVSEDTAMEIADRENLLGSAPERHVIHRPKSLLGDWNALIEAAVDAAREGGHSVIVFDGFTKMAGFDEKPELANDASAVQARMNPLLRLDEDLAIIVTHHLGKRGHTRGSTEFDAAPDVIMRLQRRANISKFDVRSLSKLQATPRHLRGDLDFGTTPAQYRAVGGGSTSTATAIWDAIEGAGQEGATKQEIQDETGAASSTIQVYVRKWLGEGKVEPVGGSGVKGRPKVVRVVQK